jgi:hypothetical protein
MVGTVKLLILLGQSHSIQAETPPENVIAMFDTAATKGTESWERKR